MQFFVVALFRLTFTINFVVVLLVESLAIEFIYLNVGQLKLIVVTVFFAFFLFFTASSIDFSVYIFNTKQFTL